MTLESAIEHCEEVANGMTAQGECPECAADHRQLAKWLKDYKRLKEQEPILNKIRAEIIEEKDFAYADFEQYKVDYLGVDAEYAEDELPLDDFRYGMERAIEIIDKYKAERSDTE